MERDALEDARNQRTWLLPLLGRAAPSNGGYVTSGYVTPLVSRGEAGTDQPSVLSDERRPNVRSSSSTSR
jgi:hypothetical protein